MAEEITIADANTQETVVTAPAEEKKEFDPTAFSTDVSESKVPLTKEKLPDTNVVAGEENKETEEEDHLADDFTWDTPVVKPAETTETTSTETTVSTETKAPVIADFSAFSKEAGIEAKDETEFMAKVKAQQQELRELKTLALGGVTSKEIESVSALLKLPDEDLLRHDLKLQGLSEATINKVVDKAKDNGDLDVEAEKVRIQIGRFIESKKFEKINADKQKAAQADHDNRENLKAIRAQIDKTDELFGFKIAKPENMQKVRDDHFNYVTSGQFLKEITETPETAIQAAFLWRHRDTMRKAMDNRAKSQGKQEVLNKLQNTQLNDTGRVHVAGKEEEAFNPVKFREGAANGS